MNTTQKNTARTGSPQPGQAHKSGNPQPCEKLARAEEQHPRGRNDQNHTQSFGSLRNRGTNRARNTLWPRHGIRPMIGKPTHGPLKRAGSDIGTAFSNSVKRGPSVQNQSGHTLATNAARGGVKVRNQNELFAQCHHGDEHTERFPHRQRKFFRLTETKSTDRIPHMTETIQDRLKRLIAESGKSVQAVSKEADLDKETVRKLLKNPNQKPSFKTVEGLARVLNVSENYILKGAQALDQETDTTTPDESASPAKAPSPSLMTLDVPVMGTAAGSLLRGAFKVTEGPVDYVRRPPSLAGAADIYALYVAGSSMEPQFFPGELIYLNPHRPAKQGDIVVVQSKSSDFSDTEASLGIYLRTTEHDVVIGKRNPQAEVRLPRELVTNIHRVLNINELLGS